jgi:single-stranded-DNA-specific exonuclease
MESAISCPTFSPGGASRRALPTLQNLLPDPYCLKDMEAAAKRIAGAIERGETVAATADLRE